MTKSIYDEALEIIDKNTFELGKGLDVLKPTYRESIVKALEQAQKQEQDHIEYSKKVQDQFSNDTKRIGILESKFINQEKLLGLYKQLNICYKKLIEHESLIYSLNTWQSSQIMDLEHKIKELENE